MTSTGGEGHGTQLSELGRRGCECIGCLRLFWGVPAFDAHRIGHHGNGRHCADDAEIEKAGLALDERGVWTWAAEIGKPRPKPVFDPAGRAGTEATSKAGKAVAA